MTFEEVERGYFEELAKRHALVADAAREAGMTRHSLSRRIRRLGLSLVEEGHEYGYGDRGTTIAYNRGCRCTPCRDARRAYVRKWTKGRMKKAEDGDPSTPYTLYEVALSAALASMGVHWRHRHAVTGEAARARRGFWLALRDTGMSIKETSRISAFGKSYATGAVQRGLYSGAEELQRKPLGKLSRAKRAAARVLAGNVAKAC